MTANDVIRITSCHQIFSNEKISEHLKDIVLLYAFGFTIDEIADEKKVKADTIRVHLMTARKAFECGSLNGLRSIVLLRLISNPLWIHSQNTPPVN